MLNFKFEKPRVESSADKRIPLPDSGLENQVSSPEANQTAQNITYLPKNVGEGSAPRLNLRTQVEDALANGLENIYLEMDAATQNNFRLKGEEVSLKIADLISRGKATLNKVLKLIIQWLRIIPGVSKYFLEQEAKIRADSIIKLQKK